jgi:hypothetical protein
MEAPQGNKPQCHFFSCTKLENRRAEQVLPEGGGWHLWKGGRGREIVKSEYGTHVCKWENGIY